MAKGVEVVSLKPFNPNFVLPLAKFYDDVVDKTDFKKGSDTARNKRLGDTGGSVGDGLYDFVDGKIDNSKVTAIDLALRSGHLDRADVDTLSRFMQMAAEKEAAQNDKEKLEKEREKLQNERQEFLDKEFGFKPSSSSEPSK